MFLKNKALRVSVVDAHDPKDIFAEDGLVDRLTLDPNEINNLLKDQVQNLGMTIAAVAAAVTVLATAREVIVNNTNPANHR